MSDHCQQSIMLKQGYDAGPGECQEDKALGGVVKPNTNRNRIPKIGNVVNYNTTEQERKDMTNCPPKFNNESKTLPAVVVAVWGTDENASVNLKVFMDGNSEDLWKTSVPRGDNETNWNFPVQD